MLFLCRMTLYRGLFRIGYMGGVYGLRVVEWKVFVSD